MPQRGMSFGATCAYQPQNKSKGLCEDAGCQISPVPTWAKRLLSVEETITPKETLKKPDYIFKIHKGTTALIFGDIYSCLKKLKINWLVIMIIVTFEVEREKLASLKTPS